MDMVHTNDVLLDNSRITATQPHATITQASFPMSKNNQKWHIHIMAQKHSQKLPTIIHFIFMQNNS